jgi:sulfate permease, SulP family
VRWLFPSLRGYGRGWLHGDLIAGLTVWAVLVPEALAYASIAGVSPVVGLYAAPGALILYAALGSSRQLIAGPMSATAALSAATVAALVPVGSDRFTAMTAALAITTGVAALLAGVLRHTPATSSPRALSSFASRAACTSPTPMRSAPTSCTPPRQPASPLS